VAAGGRAVEGGEAAHDGLLWQYHAGIAPAMQLFHFSEDPSIETFAPRPVVVPARRALGCEWLNGPLVWAIDDWHQPMYLFPRDCPRILIWPTAATDAAGKAQWWGASAARMIAFIERRWMERMLSAAICRYALPPGGFETLDDAGMSVSRIEVQPIQRMIIADLPLALAVRNVELRPLDDLVPRSLWSTSLHASGIRLRNAVGWDEARLSPAGAEGGAS
jgi:hypothetical protein